MKQKQVKTNLVIKGAVEDRTGNYHIIVKGGEFY